MTPSLAVTAWDAWLRQQANRDDPVGDTARQYVDDCQRSDRPAISVGVMRLLVESEGALDAPKALEQAWTEYTSDPSQARPDPHEGGIPPHRLDRAAAKGMLAAADAQGLRLAQHKLVEDAAGGPVGVERTDEPMTLIPEAFGWTREQLEADDPDDQKDLDA